MSPFWVLKSASLREKPENDQPFFWVQVMGSPTTKNPSQLVSTYFSHDKLLGGIPTPLKNDGVRQFG
jgi:hypothetical protein